MKLGSVIENPKDVLEVRIEFIHGDAEFYSKEIVRFKRNSVLHHIFCLIYDLANKLLNIETSDVLIEIAINEEESFVLENPFACRFLFDSVQCFLDLLNNIFSKLRQQDNKIVIRSHEHKNLVLEFKI